VRGRWIPPLHGIALWPLSAIFLPLTALAIVLGARRRPRAYLAAVFAAMWLLSACVFQGLMPQVNDVCSARLVGRDIARRVQAGDAVATFRVQRGILNFYAESEIPEVTAVELPEYLGQPRHAVVMAEKEFGRQRAGLGNANQVLAGYYVVDRRYVIVGKPSEPP
jgi:hypothetical protein